MITLASSTTPTAPYSFDIPAYAGCFALPEVAMDRRHIFMLHDILCAWPFKSALEIGQLQRRVIDGVRRSDQPGQALGESAALFLRRVGERQPDGRGAELPRTDRVQNHPAAVVGGAGFSKEPFDFVLVDGAHDIDSVSLEMKRLLKRRRYA
jgi:hypothetical protein